MPQQLELIEETITIILGVPAYVEYEFYSMEVLEFHQVKCQMENVVYACIWVGLLVRSVQPNTFTVRGEK
jgi:hypothetical protein